MIALHHQISIAAEPASVYAAIATSEGNRGWWTADSTVESKVGGKAEFGFDDRAALFRMTVDKLVPNKAVVMTCRGDQPEWEGTTLTWQLKREGDETSLLFTHGGWREMTDFCASCNSMWGQLMFRLKRYAESGKSDPQWTE